MTLGWEAIAEATRGTGVPGLVPRARLWRRLVIALAALGLLAAPLPAAEPDWPDEPYAVDIVEQDLVEVLRDFAATLGISLRVSETVTGTVRGRLPALPPREFLDLLARIYGLVWYYDGASLYVYGIEEVSSEFIRIDGVEAEALRSALEELRIYDERFPFRVSPGLGAVLISGPPRYIQLVQSAAELLAELRPIEAEMVDIRVFPLRFASADDREFSVRGRRIVVPGVATILRRLVGDVRAPLETLTDPFDDLATMGRLARTGFLERRRAVEGNAGGALAEPAPDDPAEALAQQVRPPLVAGPQAMIEADPRQNAIVVRDVVERMPIYQRLIADLDRQQRLVEIEVVIADIGTDRLGQLGVQWQVSSRDGTASVGIGNPAAGPLPGLLQSGMTLTALIRTDPVAILARIQALEETGDAQVLSRPSVLTFNNLEAIFDQSETFFVRLEGQEAVELVEVAVGSLLQVTPHIVEQPAGEQIRLVIDIEDGARLPTGEAVDQIPALRRSQISTQALVEDRQALLIGGFYRDSQSETVQKVPLLGDIPVVGSLFFRSTQEEQRSVVRLFMIRPVVVTLPEVGGPAPPAVEAPALAVPEDGGEAAPDARPAPLPGPPKPAPPGTPQPLFRMGGPPAEVQPGARAGVPAEIRRGPPTAAPRSTPAAAPRPRSFWTWEEEPAPEAALPCTAGELC